jgi:hypothetical protein
MFAPRGPRRWRESAGEAMGKRDFAIVVGIGEYPELAPLGGPEHDARAFEAWLLDKKGGAVPPEQIARILSSNYGPPFAASADDAEPTQLRIQGAVNKLRAIARRNDDAGEGRVVGDRLYLYFAGHGFAPRDDQTAILTANARREDAGNHWLGQYTADWFRKAGYFEEIFLFMDCCRETYSVPSLYMPISPEPAQDEVERRWFQGMGTKLSRLSREKPIDGTVRGVFTTALLRGLDGAAAVPGDPQGKITVGSLSDYLYNGMKTLLTPEERADPEIPQEPDVLFEPKWRDEWVVAYARKKPKVLTIAVSVHLPAAAVGGHAQIIGTDAAGKEIELERAKAPAVWQVKLARGFYRAQAVVGGQIVKQRFEVTGAEQGAIDVQL